MIQWLECTQYNVTESRFVVGILYLYMNRLAIVIVLDEDSCIHIFDVSGTIKPYNQVLLESNILDI